MHTRCNYDEEKSSKVRGREDVILTRVVKEGHLDEVTWAQR